MKIKFVFAMICFFAYAAFGIDPSENLGAMEFLKEYVGVVSSSSTNLHIKFKSDRYTIYPYSNSKNIHFRSSEFMDTPLTLSPDKEKVLVGRDGIDIVFIPAVFANQLKGFRIMLTTYSHFGSIPRNSNAYVALSDTPVDMSEEDFLEDIPVKEKTSAELDAIMREQYKARSAALKARRDQAQTQASNETSSASSPVPFSAPIFAETNSPITQAPDAATPEQIAQGETARDAATQDETDASGASHFLWLFAFPAAACILFFVRKHA